MSSPQATISWKPCLQDIRFYGAYKTAYKSGEEDSTPPHQTAPPYPGVKSGDLHGIQTGKAKGCCSWGTKKTL